MGNCINPRRIRNHGTSSSFDAPPFYGNSLKNHHYYQNQQHKHSSNGHPIYQFNQQRLGSGRR